MPNAFIGPGWVNEVPAPFQGAAQSIERLRVRMDGDPGAIARVASIWREQSATVERTWRTYAAAWRAKSASWEGNTADAYRARARNTEGELTGVGSQLRFTAEGLDLIAKVMVEVQRTSAQHVRTYVAEVTKLYAWYQAQPEIARASAKAELSKRAAALGNQAMTAIQEQAHRLDGVLASTPGSFMTGPKAPWRKSIFGLQDDDRAAPGVMEAMSSSAFGGSLTVPLHGRWLGLRVSRAEGMIVSRDSDGRIVIGLRDFYGAGPHLREGRKTSLDHLPKSLQDKISRTYGEIEGAVTVGYIKRYKFDTITDAQEFVDRLEGRNPWEQVTAAARSAVGFYAGPMADRGEWHDKLTGRTPDETTFTIGVEGKANGDIGIPLVASGSGRATGAASLLYTERSDGTSSLGYRLEGESKNGWTAGYGTEVFGGGKSYLERTEYDVNGDPTRYTQQRITVGDYDYLTGTNNSYLGMHRVPGTHQELYFKVDLEDSQRTLETRALDLRDPQNRAAYTNQHVDRGTFEQWLDAHAGRTLLQYDVQRQGGEATTKVDTSGVKAGPQFEQQYLRESWWADPNLKSGRDANGNLIWRPIPRDPVIPGDGRLDVLDRAHQAG
ncbi:MAG: hypothetical protein ACRC35_05880 [Angustibacter sp.]